MLVLIRCVNIIMTLCILKCNCAIKNDFALNDITMLYHSSITESSCVYGRVDTDAWWSKLCNKDNSTHYGLSLIVEI